MRKSLLSLAACLSLSICYGDDVTLEAIEVIDTAQKTRNSALLESKATSTIEIKQGETQSLDDVVRSVPGAFTNVDKSTGTINVNVRGMSGFGRVNTMIDGVSQTFYAASADGGGPGGGTSSFGAMIDPSFITGVDIERGSFSGRGGRIRSWVRLIFARLA